jgi:membrane protease YdiL (CAAX protease family)
MVELSAVLLGIFIIRSSGMPLRDFGLNFKDWKRSLLDGFLFSVLIIFIMLALKLYLFKNQVKDFELAFFTYPVNSLPTYIYMPISLLQEFLARGIIQTAFLIGIVHRYKNFMAVVMSAAIFGAVHANYSFVLAISSMLLSIGWGYIYLKRPTIVGACFSHYLIGLFAWLLGFWDYITGNTF